MKKRNNNIGTFFLWLAGFILLAHNVIPHHHHFELELDGEAKIELCCNDHLDKEPNSAEHANDEKIHTHQYANNHQHADHKACHFNVETTPRFNQLTIDLFIGSKLDNAFFYFPKEEKQIVQDQTPQYDSINPEYISLRGPPSIG